MTLEEAFILTCHTSYVADSSFIENEGPSQLFLDKAAQLLKRDVFMEEFIIDKGKDIIIELKKASYDDWMEVVNATKES